MADRDPADQQINRNDTASQMKKGLAKENPGLEDSIDKAEDNQGEVQPDDYPEKAGDVPL
jgi:hypothetical protein